MLPTANSYLLEQSFLNDLVDVGRGANIWWLAKMLIPKNGPIVKFQACRLIPNT